jgi:phosphate-selective porin OprO and OprP
MRRLPLLVLLVLTTPLAAQSGSTLAVDGRGVTFASADGATRITMRFRIQQLWQGVTEGEDDLALVENHFRIRRTRFRLGGTVFDPRLSFNLQLSFTRDDQDWRDTEFPNVLRDAAVTYQATPNLRLTGGQTKLPGNRQRVISSADLELPERSIVNNRFTFDRDVGVQVWFADTLHGMPFHVRTALSNGEGRNSASNDTGMAVTGRVELQPFGGFAQGGDDFEGDLVGETTPKLAIAVSAMHNSKSQRTLGQLGVALFRPVTSTTYEADVLLKYRGLSVYGEAATRDADDPITTAPGQANRYVYVGSGRLLQASYQVGDGWAPVARWAVVTPDDAIADQRGAARQEQLSLGVTKYFRRHRVKSTVEFVYDAVAANAAQAARANWISRWALEVGI